MNTISFSKEKKENYQKDAKKVVDTITKEMNIQFDDMDFDKDSTQSSKDGLYELRYIISDYSKYRPEYDVCDRITLFFRVNKGLISKEKYMKLKKMVIGIIKNNDFSHVGFRFFYKEGGKEYWTYASYGDNKNDRICFEELEAETKEMIHDNPFVVFNLERPQISGGRVKEEMIYAIIKEKGTEKEFRVPIRIRYYGNELVIYIAKVFILPYALATSGKTVEEAFEKAEKELERRGYEIKKEE